MPPKFPTNHNNERRASWHDYNAPGIYMITIVTLDRKPLFGRLVVEPVPHIEYTPYGQSILDVEIAKINTFYPMVHVWRTCLMPDHLHLILSVDDYLPNGRHLGTVIDGFKYGCNKAYWRMVEDTGKSIFMKRYNDRILQHGHQLNGWKRYLDDNPKRLAIKRKYPNYFTVIHDWEICGYKCQFIGNRFLLDIPDKMAVVVHRADSDDVFKHKMAMWLACGCRGGVLISAAIAPREKEVMRMALDNGYSVIWLRENGFPELYKPAGEAFDACSEGRLLQLSPNDYHFDRRTITRQQCLALNHLAEILAAYTPDT